MSVHLPEIGPADKGTEPGRDISGTRLIAASYLATDHFRHNKMDTIIIHKTRNTAAPPKIKYVVSVSATKAEGGPSILIEHFSPSPKISKKVH